tara:strand:+ start:53 stop:319 length:267 start_codon:yes stop_codon:yes gene_type:complete
MKKRNIESLIEKKIKENYPDANYAIQNVSDKHKKHKQNIPGDETHFIINLKTKKFSKLSRLERQKVFLELLGKEIIDNVHSISLKLTD